MERNADTTKTGIRRYTSRRSDFSRTESTRSHSMQILWTCAVALAVAAASIYKLTHPLMFDERMNFREARAPAPHATTARLLIDRSVSAKSVDDAGQRKLSHSVVRPTP